MSELKTCIVCLSTEVQLFKIGQGELRKLYNLISGLQTGISEKLANYVCYLCLAYIRRFKAFQSKCQRTYNTLYELSKAGLVTTYQVNVLDKKSLGIEFPFVCKNVFKVCNNSKFESEIHETSGKTSSNNITWDIEDTYNCWIANVDVKCEEEAIDLKTELSENDSIHNNDNELLTPKQEIEIVQLDQICSKAFKKEDKSRDQNPLASKNLNNFSGMVKKQKQGQRSRLKKPDKHMEKIKSKRKDVVMEYVMSTAMTPQEQYQVILDRKTSRNYLESKFKCELCYRGFKRKITFDNHSKSHDPNISGPLQCDICKIHMKLRRRMNGHMKSIHHSKYNCKVCSFMTYCRHQAMVHNKFHRNVTYNCPHCDRTFTSLTTYLGHVRIKHPSTFVCQMCGHSFVSKMGLSMHMHRTHSKEEVSVCEAMSVCTESALYCCECEVQFVSQAAFNTHLNTTSKHSEINQIPKYTLPESARQRAKPYYSGPRNCEVCDIVLQSDHQAFKHYKAEHPGYKYTKRYLCEVCGSTFKTKLLLEWHVRKHTQEKPFQCPYCDKRFTQARNRDRHLSVHSAERPFKCPQCGKGFKHRSTLKLHVQTVHDKIPYAPWIKYARKRKAARLNNDADFID